jgi:hypothetical protein
MRTTSLLLDSPWRHPAWLTPSSYELPQPFLADPTSSAPISIQISVPDCLIYPAYNPTTPTTLRSRPSKVRISFYPPPYHKSTTMKLLYLLALLVTTLLSHCAVIQLPPSTGLLGRAYDVNKVNIKANPTSMIEIF